jgi:hypothetical protein
MAEAIGIASGVVALTGFAYNSAKVLYQTINSFKNSPAAIRGLKAELEALTPVLESLREASTSTETTFDALKLPVLQCGNICQDFNSVIAKCVSNSNGDRRSFRDWVKLQFRGDSIDNFKTVLAAYKATISIALGDANL